MFQQHNGLENSAKMMFLIRMSTAMASGEMTDIQAQPRQMVRRQMQEWFAWMDHILDVHRNNFVFREASRLELAEHEKAIKLAIRFCLFINTVISDPDSREPDLEKRLQIRIRQLQDAYDTFHDETLSDDHAGKILKQFFPE